MTDNIAFHTAKALLAERSRTHAIIAAAKRFAVPEVKIQAALSGDVSAEEFAREAEVEFLAAQIASV